MTVLEAYGERFTDAALSERFYNLMEARIAARQRAEGLRRKVNVVLNEPEDEQPYYTVEDA